MDLSWFLRCIEGNSSNEGDESFLVFSVMLVARRKYILLFYYIIGIH